MTLVVALRCRDAIIMASDGQATVETQVPTKAPHHHKIWLVASRFVAGFAGPDGLAQTIREALDKAAPSLPGPYERLKPRVVEVVSTATKAWLAGHVPLQMFNPQGIRPYGATVFAGYDGEQPWILELSPEITAAQHEDRGYTAVGSADQFAYFALASLQHHQVKERTLSEALAIIYRVLDDAISSAEAHIGYPIHIWVLAKAGGPGGGQIKKLSEEEMKYVRDQVNAWKEEEFRALQELLAPEPEPKAKVG
jgi:proteasome beta subunit